MSKGIILITGAAGFIGSHVTRDLLRFYGEGYRIIAVDNLSGGFIENLPEGAEFVCADVSDQQIVNVIFKTFKPQLVFHLAAYAAEGLSSFVQNFSIRNNLISSVNLINATVNHKVERFVFTSSIAVYGRAKPPLTKPALPCPPTHMGSPNPPLSSLCAWLEKCLDSNTRSSGPITCSENIKTLAIFTGMW
jgi:UDP-glucose 4-epimerase